jgi:uncharacterized LabA/DUF88 family protein
MVFIDHGYLHQVLKNDFAGTPIDFKDFSEELCKDCNCDWIGTWFYDGKPHQDMNSSKSERATYGEHIKFLKSIELIPSFKLRLGKTVPVDNNGVRTFKQKGVDMMLGLDMVVMAMAPVRTLDRILLITGDADILPAVEYVRETPVEITLCVSMGAKKNYADSLKDACCNCYTIQQNLIGRCFL